MNADRAEWGMRALFAFLIVLLLGMTVAHASTIPFESKPSQPARTHCVVSVVTGGQYCGDDTPATK